MKKKQKDAIAKGIVLAAFAITGLYVATTQSKTIKEDYMMERPTGSTMSGLQYRPVKMPAPGMKAYKSPEEINQEIKELRKQASKASKEQKEMIQKRIKQLRHKAKNRMRMQTKS